MSHFAQYQFIKKQSGMSQRFESTKFYMNSVWSTYIYFEWVLNGLLIKR